MLLFNWRGSNKDIKISQTARLQLSSDLDRASLIRAPRIHGLLLVEISAPARKVSCHYHNKTIPDMPWDTSNVDTDQTFQNMASKQGLHFAAYSAVSDT